MFQFNQKLNNRDNRIEEEMPFNKVPVQAAMESYPTDIEEARLMSVTVEIE